MPVDVRISFRFRSLSILCFHVPKGRGICLACVFFSGEGGAWVRYYNRSGGRSSSISTAAFFSLGPFRTSFCVDLVVSFFFRGRAQRTSLCFSCRRRLDNLLHRVRNIFRFPCSHVRKERGICFVSCEFFCLWERQSMRHSR